MDTGQETDVDAIEAFIARWEAADASERANAPMFLTELCDLLGLPHPDPAGGDHAYVFERDVVFRKVDGAPPPTGASTSTSAAASCWRPNRAPTATPPRSATAAAAPPPGNRP